jgi:hypothetical protein
MNKLIGGRDGYYVIEKDNGYYRVDRGTYDIRVTHEDDLTFEAAVEYLRPKSQ